MKRTPLLILCLFIIPAVLLTAACAPITKPEQENTENKKVVFERPRKKPKKPKTQPPVFFSTHQVGSIVSSGETIQLTYKAQNVYLDAKFTVNSNRIALNSDSNIQPSVLGIANGTKYCWGENDCLILTKNTDGSWTIKSLPFQ